MTHLLEGWDALSDSRRRRVRAAIADTLVAGSLAQHPHYRDSPEPPRVDVYAVTRDGERTTAHFVVDVYLYCRTISGSDWAEHHIRTGCVALDEGPPEVELASDHTLHLSELEADLYDGQRVVEGIRAEQVALLLGQPVPPSARDLELARVREIVDANARAANRRTPAPAAPAEPPFRCPKCRAPDVDVDVIFDMTKMTCRACGHGETVDTYEPDDWSTS